VSTPTLLEIGLLYLAILAFANRKRSRWPRAVLPGALALLALDQAYFAVRPRFERDLRVTVLDVGQGDAILFELPFGKRMLLDGGGFEASDFDPGEKLVAPFLWGKKIRRLDYVVNSHPHFDHFGGLRFILREFSVGEVWKNPQDSYYREYREFLGIIGERKIPLRILDAGAPDAEINGVKFEFLNPPPRGSGAARQLGGDQNENSLVLRVSFGETRFLFAADIMNYDLGKKEAPKAWVKPEVGTDPTNPGCIPAEYLPPASQSRALEAHAYYVSSRSTQRTDVPYPETVMSRA
jgi:competence protein ComEC